MNHETHEKHEKILYAEEVYALQGAIFEVRRQMGAGFLEAVYQECLTLELGARGIPFRSMPALSLAYKGQTLKQLYIPDFICFGLIVLELKACRDVAPEHRAQLLNYLRASGIRLGLLVNFGAPVKVGIERIAL